MVPNYTNLSKNFFHDHSNEYDLSTNEGCGKYTEAFVKHARNLDPRIGHLKKNPGQTQYNGHANDAVLYPTGVFNISDEEIYHAVDIIARAEQPKPWKPEGINDPPEGQWSEDIHEYKSSDWLAEPGTSAPPATHFPGYEELGGDALCREVVGKPLEADYKEAGQLMNDGSVVWTNRTLYDAFYYIFVEKMHPREAYERAATKHRPEWRAALGL